MPWVAGEGGGGGVVFVLVWFSLTRYDTQKNVLFKHVNWQDFERSQTGVSWKAVFIHKSILLPFFNQT